MGRAPTSLALALLGGLAAAFLSAPPAAGQQAQPTIVGIGVVGCVNVGDRVTVRGSGFGRAGGKALVLRDPNTSVELPVTNWTDRSILATVPKHRSLVAGNWYVLGIQEARSGQWLSGQGRPLQLCGEGSSVPLGGAGARVTVVPGGPADPTGPAPRTPEPRRPQPPGLTPPGPTPPGAVPPAPPALPPAPAVAADADQEPDEVLAIAATLADANGLAQQVAGLGYAVRSLQELPALGFTLLRLGLPAGLDVPAALAALRQAFPATLFDANSLYEPEAASSANAEPRHYAKALIGWPDGDTACGSAVSLGLVDTAVDRRHRALQGQDVQVRSFIAAGVPPAPPDHGTAVAALLVGAPGDTAAGLLPAARLYAAAIFATREDRVVGTTDAVARAVDWLGQQGTRVVNLSLSGPGNQVMRLTVERAHAAGMLLVAAAGNEGPNAPPVFPAGYPPVLAVTAVDASLQPYAYANRGGYIDLAAPGVDVWSARGGEGGRYNTGTSFATPFVTAAAAAALSQAPDAAPDAIRQRLQAGARDLGVPGQDRTFGWGLVQRPPGC
jgi:hypothetical protein